MAPGNALSPQLIAPRPQPAGSSPRTAAAHAPQPPHTPHASHGRAAHGVQAPDVRRFAFELPARAESVARARHLVGERLLRWRIGQDVRDTAELVVSELFTNAVVHTGSSRVVCELRDRGERLRIAVHDEGCPAGPRLRHVDAEECGRGLLLVDAVAGSWGAHDARYGAGRVVWAELAHGVAGAC
ncbi:ATP-binding protein [Streptomyces sp. NPDC047928]|uniref:ATP-binding protein n=1 Tax=unclassified Streptomyces TaxID=2593676 RepID=UPI003718231A